MEKESSLPVLGQISQKDKKDLDKFNLKAFNGQLVYASQSTPSAYGRALPILLVASVGLIILGFRYEFLAWLTFLAVIAIVAVTFYLIIKYPDRVLFSHTQKTPLRSKKDKEVINGEVNYQPIKLPKLNSSKKISAKTLNEVK